MSNGAEPTVTGPIETISRGPRQQSLVAIGAAAVGSVLAIFAFYAGIPAAIDGSGNGAGIWLVIMLVGLVLDLIAIVLAIVSLVRGAKKALPIAAILVAPLPVIWLGVLALLVRP